MHSNITQREAQLACIRSRGWGATPGSQRRGARLRPGAKATGMRSGNEENGNLEVSRPRADGTCTRNLHHRSCLVKRGCSAQEWLFKGVGAPFHETPLGGKQRVGGAKLGTVSVHGVGKAARVLVHHQHEGSVCSMG